jgi:hypothetical protein
MVRSLLLLTLLSGLAWWLHGEQQRGRFREVDDQFLDFLLANTRDDLKPDPAKLDGVVFLRMREEDKAEYAAWPPQPIDYQMMIKGLAPYEPATLIIAEPLQWPQPKPEFIEQLAQTLLPMPSVVLAAGATTGGKADATSTALSGEHLPDVTAHGPTQVLPALSTINAPPEPALARQSDVGCVLPGKQSMAFLLGTRAVPSLEWMAIANATHTPLRLQRLNLGAGAGLHVGDELFVPLQPDGSLPPSTVTVPAINALDLMTAALTDADVELAKTLGKGKVMVLGIDNDRATPTTARLCAQAVAAALAMPRVQVLSRVQQIIAWGVAALLGLSLLLLPKTKGMSRALLYLFLALTASYLAFQSFKIWCPPAIPAALIAASGLFARAFGRTPRPAGP